MQNSKCASYCSAIRSEMVFRHSFPGTYNPPSSDKERIQKPQVDVEKIRRLSNTSLSSHDSGVGFFKADYEIQKAMRAQRVQRPHIILLHKGRPVSHSVVNTLDNHDEFEANIVVAAATASKRHRREISIMHKRQTIVSVGDNYYNNAEHFRQFNNSAPNLYQTTQMISKKTRKIGQDENKEIKYKIPKNPLFMPKHKLLFRSVSLSIKKFVGINKEKKRQSQLIQQIHHQPKFF